MIRDLTFTSLETITAFDAVTGAYKFTLDELQSGEISQTQETQDITGKQGRKLSSIKKNKGVTVTAANGLVSSGLLELQTGSEFENGATQVLWTDYLTVNGNAATTTYTPVGTTGAEITALYLKNTDGTLGEELIQAATTSEGKFALKGKALTFTGLTDGQEIVVYYKRKITADTLANDSGKYSGKCQLYIDLLAEDICSNVYRVQIYVPKADISGEFSLSFGDDQSVHNFEAEALSGACGTAGEFFTYTVFGANAEDVA